METVKAQIVKHADDCGEYAEQTLIIDREIIYQQAQLEPEDAIFGRVLHTAHQVWEIFEKGQSLAFAGKKVDLEEVFDYDNSDDYEARIDKLTKD